jgi:hypothetical protein
MAQADAPGGEATGGSRVEPLPDSLWQRVKQEPVRTPEYVALAAADHFARPAERWAARHRGHHAPAELAQIARREHVRLSHVEGALTGLGGALTAIPDLAALAWIQGRMVFFLAAAYGFEPSHPMRPAELLALQRIYPTPAEARRALDGVGRPMAVQYVESRRDRDRQLASQLLRIAGRRLARRTVLRVAPVLAAPFSSMQNASATGQLADRAMLYYGGTPR